MPGWFVFTASAALVAIAAVVLAVAGRRGIAWRDAALTGAPIAAWPVIGVAFGVDDDVRALGFLLAVVVSAALSTARRTPLP